MSLTLLEGRASGVAVEEKTCSALQIWILLLLVHVVSFREPKHSVDPDSASPSGPCMMFDRGSGIK